MLRPAVNSLIDRRTEIALLQYVFGYAPVFLSEIATITRGGNFQKKDFVSEGHPCIHYGQMYAHYGIYTYSALTFVSPEIFKVSKKAKKNDIVMAVRSENVEDVCKSWLMEQRLLKKLRAV